MNTCTYGALDDIFWRRKPLIGMVHLTALPGSPQSTGHNMDAVIARALADARAL